MHGIWKPGSNLIYRWIYVLTIWTPLYRSKCENTANSSSTAESTSIITTTLTTDLSSTYQISSASTSTPISNTATTSTLITSNPNTSYVFTSYNTSTILSTSTETNVGSTEINVTSMNTSATSNVTSNVTEIKVTTVTIIPTVITNTTISNTSVSCEMFNTTINNTQDRDECKPIKVNKTDIKAEEWTNVTIQSNFTIPHCHKVVWIRQYNLTTHGDYFPTRYKRPFVKGALYSREICGHTYTHNLLHSYDLCISCDNGTLHLYGVNTTHSGRYTARCHIYEHNNHGTHEDKNFNLIIYPRNNTNNTNGIWICPRPTKDEAQENNQSEEKHLTTTDNSVSHKRNHYPRTSHRSAWTVTLLCVACILLFFFRRLFNKKYRMLDDTVSESEFIVRYNPEHED
ncbi:membrane protein RL12 [Human betaherpesvirus 5]|uniref:Membrane RL1 protein2 n=1 Tax=Human cytomegalovirus TaxID=10359 RepID=A0A0G2U9E8_HCMV|nr:membrane protein RL12 [Human betaherpesvirus 5]AKI07558.1 membrane RL1 protein2 [Human betaherpesvirus 5]AKI16255.1 membrane RL1 protein2 [Human betaherpesvirus 5]AKI18759.1 membrane RL1 protein2 [Human betaherpesvirus 5]AKI19931.1 membrane RL1 protein2 [Human betaherpesvirus 5]